MKYFILFIVLIITLGLLLAIESTNGNTNTMEALEFRITQDEQQILILQKKNEALTHMVKVFDERSTAICNHFGIKLKEIVEHNNKN